MLIRESEESQSDSEVVKPRKKKKAPIITETSDESESDSEVVKQPRKKKKLAVISETSDFVFDEDYDIVIEK